MGPDIFTFLNSFKNCLSYLKESNRERQNSDLWGFTLLVAAVLGGQAVGRSLEACVWASPPRTWRGGGLSGGRLSLFPGVTAGSWVRAGLRAALGCANLASQLNLGCSPVPSFSIRENFIGLFCSVWNTVMKFFKIQDDVMLNGTFVSRVMIKI